MRVQNHSFRSPLSIRRLRSPVAVATLKHYMRIGLALAGRLRTQVQMPHARRPRRMPADRSYRWLFGDSAVVTSVCSSLVLTLMGSLSGVEWSAVSERQIEARRRGRVFFTKPFVIHEGLGPAFNATSCASCHDTPRVGGSGTRPDTTVDWTFTGKVDALGAPAQRFVLNWIGEAVRTATGADERRKAPALFGLGWVEAIPLEDLRARADPFDGDRDGISGRLPWREDCVGRFGWQSSVCDLATFVTGALSRELGIETLPRSRREISERDLGDLVAYVRTLPPPQPPESQDGADLFNRARCSTCHTPITGVATMAGEQIEVKAYTDLLVHEMGGGPRHGERGSRTEFRTAPLWGISSTGPPYLHDGSAPTLEGAILRHGGEATRARRLYTQLGPAERRRLLRFVRSR